MFKIPEKLIKQYKIKSKSLKYKMMLTLNLLEAIK